MGAVAAIEGRAQPDEAFRSWCREKCRAKMRATAVTPGRFNESVALGCVARSR
jgi:hypothetical protein